MKQFHKLTGFAIASVWIINGLFCKVLSLVPRHEQIVARFFGEEYAPQFTIAIGIAEILMALWILSRLRSRLNAVSQIMIIALMNVMEQIVTPDLLLWGRLNLFFAGLFILVIYLHEFRIPVKLTLR